MAKTKKREDLGQTKKEIQDRMELLNAIDGLSIEQIADATLTNFNKKPKNDAPHTSAYYNIQNYVLRFSDHLSKTSNGNIQFVELEGKVLMWKTGIVNPGTGPLTGEYGYILKTITKTELFDILTMINHSAKYFVP